MLRRSKIEPPEPADDFKLLSRTPPQPQPPPSIVTADLFRSPGLMRLLGPIGSATIDIHKLLGMDRGAATLMPHLNNDQEIETRLHRLQNGLNDAELDDLIISNPYIKENPPLVDSILETSSPRETVEYIRQHIEEKLNTALMELRTEAQRATASKRAKGRGLPIKEPKKFAASVVSSEVRAIERRLKAHYQPKNRRGPKAEWNRETLLPVIECAVFWLKSKGRAKRTSLQYSHIDLALKTIKNSKEIEQPPYCHAAEDIRRTPTGDPKDIDSLKKRIGRHIETEWNEIRRQWADQHRNGT